jgi:hemin uptake protein HemP
MQPSGSLSDHRRSSEPDRRADQQIQAPASRRIRSADLFAGRPSIVIDHDGVEYRLRITRLGKLILTK